MNYPNPTPVRVGLSGTLAGQRWQVAGRIVLGMEEAGQIYYWNEYHLLGENSQTATLVFEETETGAQWRLFTLFEPENPMTLAEVSTHKVGDPIHLDGTPLRVTVVDESRVYFLEGTPPEGVELGDVAHYFNAEAAGRMIVVSWTGNEVEYYRGLNLPADAVAAAFGLPKNHRSGLPTYARGKLPSGLWLVKGLPFVLPLIFVVSFFKSCGIQVQVNQPSKPKAIAAPLAAGAQGTLEGVPWSIATHQLVEIAMTGRQYDRHEYTLQNPKGDRGLLVYEPYASATRWLWYRPIKSPAALSPVQAGALKVGDNLAVADATLVITELFHATDGQSVESVEKPLRLRYFCFNGQAETNIYLARWNEREIALYQGQLLPDRLVRESFPQPKP